ncbi:pentapeptide repeat-containing protein [Variovorax sp. J22R193]|uniref:pentapeptide repeat-containing protein n=1 Tax=Variovorax fucosicus TaxID=3053517 RepID=UPI002578E117|nr:pentapeptide repeat-containing protein [Variovorax sp. J22R193]MDM0041840.1 pentapeptide repeat-containing protein [Variovorax sp. J22R193]
MTKITIVSRFDADKVLFECPAPDGLASGLYMRHALEKATAARAYLSGAYLRGAYLRGADLSGADLSGADLSGADLRGADLRGADLRGADLSGADLSGADLRGADLRGADLSGAYLRGADGNQLPRATPEQAIENLDKVRAIVLDDQSRLNMGHWHGNDEWRNRSCAEEAVCGTTHCMAGWLQVCTTEPALKNLEPQLAGILAAPIASKMFFRDDATALKWLTDRAYVAESEEAERRAAERKAKREARGNQP